MRSWWCWQERFKSTRRSCCLSERLCARSSSRGELEQGSAMASILSRLDSRTNADKCSAGMEPLRSFTPSTDSNSFWHVLLESRLRESYATDSKRRAQELLQKQTWRTVVQIHLVRVCG